MPDDGPVGDVLRKKSAATAEDYLFILLYMTSEDSYMHTNSYKCIVSSPAGTLRRNHL